MVGVAVRHASTTRVLPPLAVEVHVRREEPGPVDVFAGVGVPMLLTHQRDVGALRTGVVLAGHREV